MASRTEVVFRQPIIWFLLIVLTIIGIGVLVGHSEAHSDAQEAKFQMECINSGGKIEVLPLGAKLICNK